MIRRKKQTKERTGIYSITHVIVLLLLLIICAAVGGGYYYHTQQQKTILANAAQNQFNSLQKGITDLEERLERLESFIYNFFYDNDDIQTLKYEKEEVPRFYAEQNILSVLNQIISLTNPMDCVWIQYPDQDSFHYLARYSNNGILGEDLAEITEYVQAIAEDPQIRSQNSDKWDLILCNQKYYLLWKIELNGILYGAWVRLSQISQTLKKTFTDETDLLFYDLDSSGLLYENNRTVLPDRSAADNISDPADSSAAVSISGPGWYEAENGDVCAVSFSEKLGLQIKAILPKTAVLLDQSTPTVEYIIPLSLGLMMLFVIFMISQILLYRPFRKLANSIKTANVNNSDAPLQTNSALIEVNTLTNLINSLMQETDRLKTQIYESQVRERDIQCQYLQIRLKSHFYMNCLSIIHSLAQVDNTDLIQELAVYLTRYLRFLHDDTDRFVSLDAELNHVRNYMHIQELRFPGLFHYIEDVDVSLLDCMIPPILLETFIENSVEHGMILGKDNWVKLTARFLMKEETPGIDFIIEDIGCGFDPAELEYLAKTERSDNHARFPAQADCGPDPDESHVSSKGLGIRNVISRLQILYGGNAEYQFQNKEEGGAIVRLFIPMDNSDFETEEV